MALPGVVAALVSLSLLASGCHGGIGARSWEPKRVKLDEPFRLSVGESARVEDAEVALTFEKVTNDSRCPKDVNCIQAGEAVVLLAVETDGGGRAALELAVPPGGPSPESTFGGLTIVILELHPQKESTKSIDPSAYVATVRVRRS